MLRTNLSTRPFYNERGVHALAALVVAAVLALTAWQVVRVVRLSEYKTRLNTVIARDRGDADRDADAAQQIRKGLDQKQLATLAGAAKEANNLIAERTFSWTQLFNQIEATLPNDVMLMGVNPKIENGVTQLNLDVQAKSEDDIQAFWDRLEKTGQFRDSEWSNVTITDQGLHRMTMTVLYTPGATAARPAAAAPAEKPPAKPDAAAKPEGRP